VFVGEARIVTTGSGAARQAPGEFMKPSQSELARRFASLHLGPRILVLPNAWDATSARIFEDAGFAAIATTSGGIANAHGYVDGQDIPRDELLGVVRTIAEAVQVPVTADMLAGYGTTPNEIAITAREVISSGAIGMNLEDGVPGMPDALIDMDQQKENIQAAVEAGQRQGIEFVVNARTDVFLHSIGPAETRLARTIQRLNAYRAAGARSLFAPGVTDKENIGKLVSGVEGPLNVLANPGTPSVPELERLGVRRVSLGSGPMRATLGLLVRIARQLSAEGSFALMLDGMMTYADANHLVAKKSG